MMKSQVNALLHVLRNGLVKDAILAYPALEGHLSKDMDRLALYCQNRGLGLFTLDLPHLQSLLLKGLKMGRLSLEGPLSRAVSKEVRVPRLFSGLWLRVFDKDACLKHEVDVTALAFLKMFLTFGGKLEVECTRHRVKAMMGAYYDVESKLRSPTLGWEYDSLELARREDASPQFGIGHPEFDFTSDGDSSKGLRIHHRGTRYSCGFHSGNPNLLYGSSVYPRIALSGQDLEASCRTFVRPMHVHLVQAVDDASITDRSSLPLFSRTLDDEARKVVNADIRLLNNIQKVADIISGAFGEYDPIAFSGDLDELSLGIGFKHGPGAVAEKKKNWEKSQFDYWPRKLQNTFPWEACGRTASSTLARPLNHEVPSRLMGVPKTAKGPRLIAAEPTAHQWCQQLTWSWLRKRCRETFGSNFIDFKRQHLSAEMVLQASLDRTLATVDLSDASDRLSCWTVERMFRGNPSLLTALHAARTRYLRDEVSGDNGFLKTKKFASQGTATTFPIMSLTMLFISLGSCIEGEVTWKKIWELRDQVRVYGDDIVIPSHGYVQLCRAMELLQLKVNMEKSYVDGFFRESCGTWGYKGYDVTPVRPKSIIGDSPASSQAVVDNTNNLFNKGYWHASTAQFDLLPARIQRGIRIVGRLDVGFSGLASYTGSDESHLRKRWNSRLHRYEVRVWRLSPNRAKRYREGYPAMLDFLSSVHNPSQARVVSKYADARKVRSDFSWEPACVYDSHVIGTSKGVPGCGSRKLPHVRRNVDEVVC